ncbi:MAG: hypothetical protein EOP55_05770 [Sphingobacteriales bacterium]|nr:MAG: hypothetical protein EOP55_05770 [Sphingobacteriales bacterium]
MMMKASVTEVKISEPCSQNWEEMENNDENKFCLSCNKSVIDFTGYTNAEILNILANSSAETCGRLTQTQLDQLNYYVTVIPANKNWMKYLGVLAIGASVFIQDAKASAPKPPTEISPGINKLNRSEPVVVEKIYGYIFDADRKALAGIRVVLTGTKYFALTDKNGKYEIAFKKGFDIKKTTLVVESVRYAASKQINYSIEKQSDLVLNKMEPMIVGKIMVTKRDNRIL